MRQRYLIPGALLLGAAVGGCGDDSPQQPGNGTQQVDVAAEIDRGPGNLTILPDGRRVLSLHQYYSPVHAIAQLSGQGSSASLADYPAEGEGKIPVGLTAVLGIRSDTAGVLYILDNGGATLAQPKLVRWDSNTETLVDVIPLGSVSDTNSFLNDMAFDYPRRQLYISDPAGGTNSALVVVDLQTKQARRVLQGDPSTVAEPITLTVEGKTPTRKLPNGALVQPRIGVDGIAIDYAHEWVYYGAVHGTKLYRIRAEDLANPAMAGSLGSRVETYATKPPSDGIAIDSANNIYLGDLPNNAFGVIGADRQYRELARGSQYKWIDDFEFGPDGKLYVVSTQLHLSPELNAGQRAPDPPFRIFSTEPLAHGRQGY